MPTTYSQLIDKINLQVVENTSGEISATIMNELLRNIMEFADTSNIDDARLSANIVRIAQMTAAITTAVNDAKTELRGGAPTNANTLKKLDDKINNVVTTGIPDPIPPGLICMWAGTVPPAGWALCDGAGGRPDLRGRFVVGYYPGNVQVDHNAIGKTGGIAKVPLTRSNLPEHQHEMNGHGATANITSSGAHTHSTNAARQQAINVIKTVVAINSDTNVNDDVGATTINSSSHTHPNSSFSGSTGNGVSISASPTPVENRPPYYTLAYIIKL